MKKLEKLKGKKPLPYKLNLKDEHYLEKLQQNKYIIFEYKKSEEKFIWKFIKTEKITNIEVEGEFIKITTNMDGKYFLARDEFYITNEFTLAKVMYDKKNGTKTRY